MPELGVDAIAVAGQRHAGYRPVVALADNDYVLPLADKVAECTGIPVHRLWVLAEDRTADVATLALTALGPPAPDQPLFLVRSGPLRDPYVVALAQLVHEGGWTGEDIGITHLDELGGTVVFDLLDWAPPDWTTAGLLICDDPLFTDAEHGCGPIAAVGLRVRRGPGPLRVLGCGEGTPTATGRRFVGSGACDSWLALHAALVAGQIDDGDQIVLHTRGSGREGWLSLAAVDVSALLLADALPDTGSHAVPGSAVPDSAGSTVVASTEAPRAPVGSFG